MGAEPGTAGGGRALAIGAQRGGRPAYPHDDYVVFNDGEFRLYRDVHLGLLTHAFNYGTACFEGMRAYWNREQRQLYLLQAAPHYSRLQRSSLILRMTLPHSVEELVAQACELLRRNAFQEDSFIRTTLYKSGEEIGVKLTGVRDSLAMYALPYGSYLGAASGLNCMVSSWRRITDQALPARAKISGSYVNSALAKSEALDNGFDEAIVLTADGHVSEGTAENLFMFKDGVAFTPPVTDDILEGITRAGVMEILRNEIGVPIVERSIDRTELYTCDELLLCGTAAQVVPVVKLDHRSIGGGEVGELCRRVQHHYFAAVRGEDPRYSHWLTPVYPER